MAVDIDELRRMLLANVPLIQHMAVDIAEWQPGRVVVEAPLEPNLNTHGTAFGGSLFCVATLAGWALTHLTLRDEGFMPSVWVLRGEIDYRRPVRGCLRATATLAPDDWEALCPPFSLGHRAQVEIPILIEEDGRACVSLLARYAAMPVESHQ